MEDIDKAWTRLRAKSTVVDNCIVYGDVEKNDYKWTSLGKRKIGVHRLAYLYHNRVTSIDDGLVVRHLCKYKGCIAKDHQDIGSSSINNYEDKIKDGTLYRTRDKDGNLITPEKALLIKHSFYPRGHELYKPKSQRAEEFGVTLQFMNYIDRGRIWAHLPDQNGVINGSEGIRERARQRITENKNREWIEDRYVRALEYLSKNLEPSTTSYNGTECALWKGGKDSKGYGQAHFDGAQYRAHILACMVATRLPNSGKVVRHLCNQKACCNPDHLIYGTLSENAVDAIKAGSKTAKLTSEMVRGIIEDAATMTQRQVASKYDITKSNVSYIVNGKTWKHIER